MQWGYPDKLLTEPWQEGSASIGAQMEEDMRLCSMFAGFVLAAVLIAGADAGANGPLEAAGRMLLAAHQTSPQPATSAPGSRHIPPERL